MSRWVGQAELTPIEVAAPVIMIVLVEIIAHHVQALGRMCITAWMAARPCRISQRQWRSQRASISEATRQCPTSLTEPPSWHLTLAKWQSTGVMQDVLSGSHWLGCQELCYRFVRIQERRLL